MGDELFDQRATARRHAFQHTPHPAHARMPGMALGLEQVVTSALVDADLELNNQFAARAEVRVLASQRALELTHEMAVLAGTDWVGALKELVEEYRTSAQRDMAGMSRELPEGDPGLERARKEFWELSGILDLLHATHRAKEMLAEDKGESIITADELLRSLVKRDALEKHYQGETRIGVDPVIGRLLMIEELCFGANMSDIRVQVALLRDDFEKGGQLFDRRVPQRIVEIVEAQGLREAILDRSTRIETVRTLKGQVIVENFPRLDDYEAHLVGLMNKLPQFTANLRHCMEQGLPHLGRFAAEFILTPQAAQFSSELELLRIRFFRPILARHYENAGGQHR